MINKVIIKFGSTNTQPPLEINSEPITIFVGPNNSGKSKLLKEIEYFCQWGRTNVDDVILQDIEFDQVLNPEFEIKKYTLNDNIQDQPDLIIVGKNNNRKQVIKNYLASVLSNPSSNKSDFCQYYAFFNTYILDGYNRTSLVDEQKVGDLNIEQSTSLGILYTNTGKRNEVQRIIFDAFEKYFVIDPTNLGFLRIRLSDVKPSHNSEEFSLTGDAIIFQRNALNIINASDGIKAFTGIILTIIAADPKIILIDEPEAFLHPSLASKLGKEICNNINKDKKNLFVSTHSANFLMGCIQSGCPINIVRLTYSKNIPTARMLPSDKLLKLFRHPLLRSTGVLNGLFYEYVVVTEADADRAFYQEINERLLMFEPEKGIPNCLFLNAQNKQTIHEIVRPLREMGIPCAAIVDIDVIKEGGVVWSNLLSSANIPKVTIKSTQTSRAEIKNRFDSKGKNFKTCGGVDVLDPPDQDACNNLFDQLDDYGIFTLRKGELESWLKSLDVKAQHSPDWLIEIFEELGEDPDTETYIKPTTGDVWDFIGKIKFWFSDPQRKGIPD